MKKSIAILFIPAAILIASCGNQSGKAGTAGNDSDSELSVMTPEQGGGIVNLNKQDFLVKVMNYEKNTTEWVFEGNKPCLIDFYADWCAPCRTSSPILEELAGKYSGRIDFYRIDTDAEQELAAVFGIQGIPSFLYVPLEGRPTMTTGIANSVEETRQMFLQNIESYLLD